MRELIRAWAESKGVSAWLGHESVGDVFTYEMYRFRCVDGKYRSIDVVYDSSRIIGSLSALNTNLLETKSMSLIKPKPVIVFPVLDSISCTWNSLKELNANGPKPISEKVFNKMVSVYFQQIMNRLYAVATEHFRVVSVQIPGRMASFVVTFRGIDDFLQPVKLHLGEVSAVVDYDFGVLTPEYKRFVEQLGEVTGGVVWI